MIYSIVYSCVAVVSIGIFGQSKPTATEPTVAKPNVAMRAERPPDTEREGTIHPPTAANAKAWILQFCSDEWPEKENVSSRFKCVDQQTAAVVEMGNRLMHGIDRTKVWRNDCAKKWPDSYTMRNACERAEIQAYFGRDSLLLRDSEAETEANRTVSSPSIRTKCARDWPDDFRMRQFCMEQQNEAAASLRRRSMTQSVDHRTIRAKCLRDWPNDFRMQNFCEEQQLKALEAIR